MEMENYHQGDLTDIIRAGAGAAAATTGSSVGPLLASDGLVSVNWEFTSPDPLLNSSSSSNCNTTTFSSALLLGQDHENDDDLHGGGFGDPFFNFRDPLLHELNDTASAPAPPPPPPPHYFSPAPQLLPTGYSLLTGASGSSNPPPPPQPPLANNHHHQHHSNLFSSRIQISSPKSALTDSSPGFAGVSSPSSRILGFKKADLNNNNNGNTIISSSSKAAATTTTSCLIENGATSSSCASAGPPLQISSPRNLGIKRRKSQAKKVVCIPAPAAANSRPSGEVVPSDLWAWRKYGQKPIKGSPYPRGYYRCSSSKGCSARKQVERSRTDPNMLVITYTSEHNHPWPTQRNALAGSTRSHPHKHHHHHNAPGSKNKEYKREKDHAAVSMSSNDEEGGDDETGHLGMVAAVKKEEADVDDDQDTKEQMMEMEMEMHHGHHHQDCAEFSEGFSSDSYRPALGAPSDFFADLGEIETDPLELLFSQGGGGADERKDEKGGSGGLEPLFSMFDWSTSALANNNIGGNSFGGQEAAATNKRD